MTQGEKSPPRTLGAAKPGTLGEMFEDTNLTDQEIAEKHGLNSKTVEASRARFTDGGQTLKSTGALALLGAEDEVSAGRYPVLDQNPSANQAAAAEHSTVDSYPQGTDGTDGTPGTPLKDATPAMLNHALGARGLDVHRT